MRKSLLRRTAVALCVLCVPGAAAAAVTIKGKLAGTKDLLNPVWEEAKDPKNHRYTFREPSPTVKPDVRVLRGHLPKELCIAVLGEKGEADKVPLRVVVAGGRTTPVTLVVPEGQQIQFENHDPFKHSMYAVGEKGGFPDAELTENKSLTWTPPAVGKYELRDRLVPSLRSWIVVEPKTLTVAYPNRKGDFAVILEEGTYTLQGYFNGEPVGDPLPFDVRPGPQEQGLPKPLTVGSTAPPKKPDDKEKKE